MHRRPEGLPHQAPEQGEDDARARRKTDCRNEQEQRAGGAMEREEGGGPALRRVEMSAGGRPEAVENAKATRRSTGHGAAVIFFLRNCVTRESSGEVCGRSYR
jgi:hypothetical protein